MTSRKRTGAKQRVATDRAAGPSCQVPGCTAVLAREAKPQYCIKRRLCSAHIKADAVQCKGRDGLFRFCFQCGKLEPLSSFNGEQRSCRTSLRQRREASCPGSRDPETCAADKQPAKEEPGAAAAAAPVAPVPWQSDSSSTARAAPELPAGLQVSGDGPCLPPADDAAWIKPEPVIYASSYDDALAGSGLSSCAAALEAACEPLGGGLLLFDAAPAGGSLVPAPAPALLEPQPHCGAPTAHAPASGSFSANSAAAELADAFCGASSSLSAELEAAAEAAYGEVAQSLSAAFVGCSDAADSRESNDSLCESLLQQLLADIQAPAAAPQHGSAAMAPGGLCAAVPPLQPHGLEPAAQPTWHCKLQHLQQCFGQLQQMLNVSALCCNQLLSGLAGPAWF